MLLPPLSDRPWEQRDADAIGKCRGHGIPSVFMICPTLDDDPQTIYPRYYWSSKTLKRGRRISWWNSTLLLNWFLKKKSLFFFFFFFCFFLFLWRVALGSLHKFPHRLIAIDRSSQFRWVAGNVIVRREKPPVVDCQHLFCFILWRLRNRLIVNNLLFRQPSCYPNWFSFLSPSKKKKSSFLRSSSKVANSPSLVLSRAFLFLFSSRQVLLLCCNERRERL